MAGKLKRNLFKGTAGLGVLVLAAVLLLGSMRPDDAVNASGEGIVESDTISPAEGNGPQKVTSLKELGIDEAEKNSGTALAGGFSNKGNTIGISDISLASHPDQYGTDQFYCSGTNTNKSIPISMKHSWTLRLSFSAGCADFDIGDRNSVERIIYLTGNDGTIMGFNLQTHSDNKNSVGMYVGSGWRGVSGPYITQTIDNCEIAQKEQSCTIEYDASRNRFTWTYGDQIFRDIDNILSTDTV